MEKATFAAGCFWQVEADFRNIPGVTRTAAGYTGGATESPTYEQVCSDRTGHAEAVLVEFDPARVTYEELVEAFWKMHDPTQVNRQGPDYGSQYRTEIFFHDSEQEKIAIASKERTEERIGRSVATKITPASEFWEAEDYHQQYLEKRGMASCAVTIQQ